MPRRLFIGLEVPPSCAQALAEMAPGLKEVDWAPADQLHLPLSLQWTVGAEEEARLREAVAEVHIAPFFLPLAGLRSFGRPPSVSLSVGVGKGHPHFFALHKHVQDAVIRAGLEPDLRPFHPHVTVARLHASPSPKLQRFLRENADTEFCLWHVAEVAVFERLAPHGLEISEVLLRSTLKK